MQNFVIINKCLRKLRNRNIIHVIITIILIAGIFKNCVTHACVRTQDLKAFCFTEQAADVRTKIPN